MNVASLELCRELYEWSGWGKSAFPYHIHDGLQKYFTYADKSNSPYIVDGTSYSLLEDERNGEHIPAYDLGYLLRKLPEVRLDTWHNGNVVIKHYTKNGVPSKLERTGMVVKAEADTAENAACKLAIELFKNNILKK